MHRTQLIENKKHFGERISVFLCFSLRIEMWLETNKSEITQRSQHITADKPSANCISSAQQPQRQLQHQQADKQRQTDVKRHEMRRTHAM